MQVMSFVAVDAWIEWVKANHPELVYEPGRHDLTLTVTTDDRTDAFMWGKYLLAQTNCQPKEIMPGTWQYTFTPGKRPYSAEIMTVRHYRRLCKYQRRARWGQEQSREWKPWFGKKSK